MKMIEDFIDYDFPSDPNYRPGYFGKQRDALRAMMPAYADVAATYSESDLKILADEIDKRKAGLEYLVTRVYNQKQEGSCVGNGSCQGHEVKQAMQFGRDRVVAISAMSLYKRIGRSAQSGAVVSDAWDEMSTRGVLPLDTPENKARFKHTHPATGFGTPLPPGWEETGKLFLGLEATIIDDRLELLSALVDGHPVIVGREGHCICYLRVRWNATLGRWEAIYVNSWGQWGAAFGHMPYGFGIDTESQIRKSSDWAYAIRSVTTPEFQMKG